MRLDALADTTVEFDHLPAMGANPNVRDLFVEIDWMDAADHSHKPKAAAIANVVAAFANATGPFATGNGSRGSGSGSPGSSGSPGPGAAGKSGRSTRGSSSIPSNLSGQANANGALTQVARGPMGFGLLAFGTVEFFALWFA